MRHGQQFEAELVDVEDRVEFEVQAQAVHIALNLAVLRAVRTLMPAASVAGISPITAIRSISNLRPSKVVLAFSWLFTRGISSVSPKLGNSSPPDSYG